MRVLLVLCFLFFSITTIASNKISIGVLAYNGKQQAFNRWTATADYLSKKIPNHQFYIKPLTLEEFTHEINKGGLDFILTNPGNYVHFEVFFGASRIVTFISRHHDQFLTQFSAVIFTSTNSSIVTLEDSKGMTLAAVSKDAFGGFQLAQKRLLEFNIDAFKDLNILWLGFPHKDIVKAVLSGKADLGTVRAGVLENMAERGKLDLSQIRILAKKDTKNFPFLHSVELYPEWPLAKLPKTSYILAKKVAIALLQLQINDIASLKSRGAGWTTPLDYTSVHDVFRTLQISPYSPIPLTLLKLWQNYWHWFVIIIIFFLIFLLFLLRLFKANKQLQATQLSLYNHQAKLENTVKQRTQELFQSNQELQSDIEFRIKSEKTLKEGCGVLQDLYSIFIRNDLSREQRLQSIIDMVRQYIGAEFAILSSFQEYQFKICVSSPSNKNLSPPLSREFAELAIKEHKISVYKDKDNWHKYIACPVFISGELTCLFEFAITKQYYIDNVTNNDHVSSELYFKILKLISQLVGNEMQMLENELRDKNKYHEIKQRFIDISPREKKVLSLLVQGESTKTMARILSISTKTIELHRSNLLRKTKSKSSIELVKLAVLSGFQDNLLYITNASI